MLGITQWANRSLQGLQYCENEAALAAVVGCEMVSVVMRHGNERMSQQLATTALAQIIQVGLHKVIPTLTPNRLPLLPSALEPRSASTI